MDLRPAPMRQWAADAWSLKNPPAETLLPDGRRTANSRRRLSRGIPGGEGQRAGGWLARCMPRSGAYPARRAERWGISWGTSGRGSVLQSALGEPGAGRFNSDDTLLGLLGGGSG